MVRGYTLTLIPKNKNKKHNDLSKGLWAASGVEGDSSGQPFREGRPVQKHT